MDQNDRIVRITELFAPFVLGLSKIGDFLEEWKEGIGGLEGVGLVAAFQHILGANLTEPSLAVDALMRSTELEDAYRAFHAYSRQVGPNQNQDQALRYSKLEGTVKDMMLQIARKTVAESNDYAFQVQQRIVAEVKSGRIKLGNNHQKGTFGEMVTDLELIAKGWTPHHKRVTNLDTRAQCRESTMCSRSRDRRGSCWWWTRSTTRRS